MTIYVCPSRDIECGSRPHSWCAACPQRSPGAATREGEPTLKTRCTCAGGAHHQAWCGIYHSRPLPTPPAPTTEPTAKPSDWKQAIDDELVTLESTADSYPTAKDALKALIDWHVSVALDPQVSSEAQALIDKGRAPIAEEERAELERLRALINTPHTDDWMRAVDLEAAHQQERWGADHDAGKEPHDWFWLLGYLSGKALAAFIKGDRDKGLHHIVSSGAVLLNWHRNVTGANTGMRPGIDLAEKNGLAVQGGE